MFLQTNQICHCEEQLQLRRGNLIGTTSIFSMNNVINWEKDKYFKN